MISVNVGTRIGEQTLSILAHAYLQLFSTGRMTEVCSRTTNIVNISFESGKLRNNLRFTQNRFVTTSLDNTALMCMDCAEGTATKATTTAYNTKLYFFQSRDTTVCFIGRMAVTHIIQIIDGIHFFLFQGESRRILDDIFLNTFLYYSLAIERILFLALQVVSFSKKGFIVLDFS